jgi:hypothetical protein
MQLMPNLTRMTIKLSNSMAFMTIKLAMINICKKVLFVVMLSVIMLNVVFPSVVAAFSRVFLV